MENPVIVSVLLKDGVDQNTFVSSFDSVSEVEKGGYFVKYSADAKVNLIATGSEVSTAIESSEILRF